MSFSEYQVAIVGSGLIGQSFAVLFTRAGLRVKLYDNLFLTDPQHKSKVIAGLRDKLQKLSETNSLFGKCVDDVLLLAETEDSLENAVKDADFIQECVFEDADIKKSVFASVDKIMKPSAILASSTSCIMPSILSSQLTNKRNAIVVHPINPPLYIKLMEIVPAPWTDPSIVSRARGLIEFIGHKPVVLKREVDGFALNRLQYAVINSAWNLVSDGLLSVQDTDTVMTSALGARYAFLGPFETMHLNAPGGLRDYMERYAVGLKRVSADMDKLPVYTTEETESIVEEMEKLVPVDEIASKIAWRNDCLQRLGSLKDNTQD